MLSNLRVFAFAAISALGAGVASADSVGVDGVIGGEWGAPTSHVNFNSGAATSNFGAPTNENHLAAYDVYVRSDAGYFYVALDADRDTAGMNWANLYFDTDPAAGNGSDVGFEVMNNRYFIAGGPGTYFDASSYLTVASNTTTGVIELAIDNSFFTSGPLAGVAWPAGYPAATGDVTLRLSQSFGYSVAGGESYGPNRLGTAAVSVVPLPSSVTAGLALMGGLGLFAGLKRIRTQFA